MEKDHIKKAVKNPWDCECRIEKLNDLCASALADNNGTKHINLYGIYITVNINPFTGNFLNDTYVKYYMLENLQLIHSKPKCTDEENQNIENFVETQIYFKSYRELTESAFTSHDSYLSLYNYTRKTIFETLKAADNPIARDLSIQEYSLLSDDEKNNPWIIPSESRLQELSEKVIQNAITSINNSLNAPQQHIKQYKNIENQTRNTQSDIIKSHINNLGDANNLDKIFQSMNIESKHKDLDATISKIARTLHIHIRTGFKVFSYAAVGFALGSAITNSVLTYLPGSIFENPEYYWGVGIGGIAAATTIICSLINKFCDKDRKFGEVKPFDFMPILLACSSAGYLMYDMLSAESMLNPIVSYVGIGLVAAAIIGQSVNMICQIKEKFDAEKNTAAQIEYA